MRVVHLANYGGPYPGSFIPMLVAAGRAVRERGGETTLAFTQIARDRPWLELLEEAGLPVAFAPRGGDAERVDFVRELLGEGDEPTVLHTHFTSFDMPALRAARGRPRTAVLWHVHTILRPEWPVRVRNGIKFGLAGRRTAAIVCVGDAVAAEVRARLAPRSKLVVLQNAIDLDRFPPVDAARRAEARRRLGLEDGVPAILHFGWDWEVKGGPLLASAAARLRADGPVTALSVGCTEDVAERERARLGLPADALRAVAPTDDVAGLYAAADVFAATSRGEAFSFAAVEALASGLPVVATDIPAHASIAREVGNVRLSASEPDALAAALRQALDADPDSAASDAVRARRRVAERMGLAAWSDGLMRLYERVLDT